MSQNGNNLNGQVYEFGQFRLEVAERRLWRAGAAVHLTPKVFDVLVALVESNGRLLEKDELIARLWPDSYVEESNLSRNVSMLRQALELDAGEELIKTVPKRGYRFVAPVSVIAPPVELAEEVVVQRHVQMRIVAAEEISEANLPAPIAQVHSPAVFNRKALATAALLLVCAVAGTWFWWQRRAANSAQPIKTLAVLPFKFVGAAQDEEYLGLALADALITRLGKLRRLTIAPTAVVLKYQLKRQTEGQDLAAAGRALKVDAVLDGRVQKFGDSVRVTLQLVRVGAESGLLWSGEVSGSFSDPLALQDAISLQVAQGLALRLTETERQQFAQRYTENAEAYQAYLRGRYFWNRRGPDWTDKALKAFARAIELDPRYALAYTGLADTYIVLGDHTDWRPMDAFPKAKDAALRALELDDTLAEAHTSLAHVKGRYEWDWAGAERDYLRAIELNPGYALAYGWYGLQLKCQRRFDESLFRLRQAQQLDPLSPSLLVYESVTYRSAGQFDQAIARLRQALEFDPDFATAHIHLGTAYLHKGMFDDALAAYRKAGSLGIPAIQFYLGHTYAAAGQRTEALKLLAEMKALSARQYIRPYGFGVLYTELGERDLAFEWLNRAVDEHDTFVSNLAAEQRFDSLRPDPRFALLLRRLGLPETKP